ncbi:MAG TPA: hypothetical protein VGR73_01910 [Bryobacteraceae bacterium]|nr:hypothetical protein [Bryobacteraceae bacterium]
MLSDVLTSQISADLGEPARAGKAGFDIDREHPHYTARKHIWKHYRDLYAGGEQFKNNATRYLIRRQREPGDVYTERLVRVFYENYVGSIVDWYAATVFRREPVLTFGGASEASKQFFGAFVEDTDRKGTALADFFRRQYVDALITGASYALVDFPRLDRKPENRAQEEECGASRAYLVEYSAEDLINWSRDDLGNYEWVVLRTSAVKKDRIEDAEWRAERRWAYYDKQSYRIYVQESAGNEAGPVKLIAQGTHGLAKHNQVPLFGLRIPEGLWMLNRAGSLQLEHFNKSNALSWALTMGLFAMPVIYSEREWSQMVGESYYIQLGPEDKFGWTEPEGKVYQIAADNLTRLQEEIYRVCYLAQAGGSADRGGKQSGLSKQRDFAITQEVLRAYGDAVKDQVRRVLKAIDAAREDGLEIGVTGMDEFDIADFTGELADAKDLLGLGIASPTMRKEVSKKLALKYLADAPQGVKDQIAAEIESDAGEGTSGNG